jgi:hypothetical protein
VDLVGLVATVEQMLEYSTAVRTGAVMPNPLGQATVIETRPGTLIDTA